MSTAAPIPFETETTPLGSQALVPGVRPVSMKARLEALKLQPLPDRVSVKLGSGPIKSLADQTTV